MIIEIKKGNKNMKEFAVKLYTTVYIALEDELVNDENICEMAYSCFSEDTHPEMDIESWEEI